MRNSSQKPSSRFSKSYRKDFDSTEREALVIAAFVAFTWMLVQFSGAAARFFSWVQLHPETGASSVIAAILLCMIGISLISYRRYWGLRMAHQVRDESDLQTQRLAYQDPLTGLENRTALNERLTALDMPSNEVQNLALIIIDLDRFKSVNDAHGHSAGDRLLRFAAKRMLDVCTIRQSVYRLGGDEFAILVPIIDCDDPTPQTIANRIISRMFEPFADGSLVHHIGASAGIAIYPHDAKDGDTLTRVADLALYSAKQKGRGQYVNFERQMGEQIRERARLESELRNAIELSEFVPHYQPIICLTSGQVIGFELLARWNRMDHIEIGPNKFIPVAEECGLVGELLLGLLDHACIDARIWDPSLTIAVNISPLQFKDPHLSQKILGKLGRHGFPAQRLSIEITENAIIADQDNAYSTILSLKNQGMKIGLDDFGTGFSSLHHLRALPFDKIKIDKSFVMNIDNDPEALKMVRAIIALANSLELPVVAEGIESEEIASMLRELGCAQGQGYLFGKPLPASEVTQMLEKKHGQNWESQGELTKRVA